MKRHLLLFLLLLLAGSVFATQMMVVGEVFSAPWCGSCPTARSALAQLAENPAAEHLIPLVWNTDTPHESPGGNDRYWWYPADGYIPWNVFGGTQLDVSSSQMLNAYNTVAAVDSPLEIDLSFSLSGSQITATAEIEVTGNITTANNRVLFVVSAPREDSSADYINHVIDKSNDIPFNLTNIGDSVTETAQFTLNTEYPQFEQNLVVLVQSHTTGNRFILQAATVSMAALTANFEANITSGPAHLGVQFTDYSGGPSDVTAWAWDFDNDGAVDSNDQNPSYIYETPGTYSVALTVTDSNGDTNTGVMQDYITVLDGSAVYGSAAGLWVSDYSPYNVIGDLTVPEGSTLEIEPGVQVLASNGAEIIVFGSIEALGLPESPIFFGAVDSRNPWDGMKVRFNTTPSIFDYCQFAMADNTALSVDDAAVNVYNTSFVNNHGAAGSGGIEFNSSSNSVVQGCRFVDNSSDANGGAVGLVSSDAAVVNCVMYNNSGAYAAAVAVKQGSTLYLENNTIDANVNTGSSGGHVAVFQSEATLKNNIIRYEDGLAVFTFMSDIYATYNNIQGGFDGTGNIDADPLWDTTIEYGLTANSPSVDAAEPIEAYNDLEDPDNAGQPLYPAMGALTGDQGCYGGPTPYELYSLIPGVDDEEIPSIATCSLSAYPNPFNPTTTIALSIPQDAQNQPVTLAIYNVRGQRIATLLDHERTTQRNFVWNGESENGAPVSSGVYFARLEVGGQAATSKLALLK